MSRVIWKNGQVEENSSNGASEKLNQLETALEEFSSTDSSRGHPGLLDALIAHWQVNKCNLSLAMGSMSANDVLETTFSFQPDHLQVFVNTEGAHPEDVGVAILPQEGGFDLTVVHRETRRGNKQRQSAIRQVQRSYRFVRPLAWDRAEYELRAEGILQVFVPGPRLCIQPLPFQPVQCNPEKQQDVFCGPCQPNCC